MPKAGRFCAAGKASMGTLPAVSSASGFSRVLLGDGISYARVARRIRRPAAVCRAALRAEVVAAGRGAVAHLGRGAFIHPRGLAVARLCEILSLQT